MLWGIYAKHAKAENLSRLAIEANKRGLLNEALQLWTAAADVGDMSAPWRAAQMLRESGRIDEAVTWYRRAADVGFEEAIAEAGRMLQDADRTDEALIWYKEAADTGDTFALDQVVEILRDKKGSSKLAGIVVWRDYCAWPGVAC